MIFGNDAGGNLLFIFKVKQLTSRLRIYRAENRCLRKDYIFNFFF